MLHIFRAAIQDALNKYAYIVNSGRLPVNNAKQVILRVACFFIVAPVLKVNVQSTDVGIAALEFSFRSKEITFKVFSTEKHHVIAHAKLVVVARYSLQVVHFAPLTSTISQIMNHRRATCQLSTVSFAGIPRATRTACAMVSA